jgi:chemotaxis protein MotB
VVVEGSQIRLRIPSDQLFVPNTSQVTGSGAAILDRIAAILKREYPQSRIAIEGHTDASPPTAGAQATHHELASAQSTAVLEIFSHRHGFPSSQLSTLAHGANDPLQDNQTPAGRAANRRLEFVIESEAVR